MKKANKPENSSSKKDAETRPSHSSTASKTPSAQSTGSTTQTSQEKTIEEKEYQQYSNPYPGEPKNTRMQVVKGCSELSFDYLAPLLPPPIQRKSFDLIWPKWREDHWTMWYKLDEAYDILTIHLWPNGFIKIVRHFPADTTSAALEDKLPLETDQPIKNLFHLIGQKHGEFIAQHLTKESKK